MKQFTYTVRADRDDTVLNALANLFEDLNAAQIQLDRGDDNRARIIAQGCGNDFRSKVLAAGATIETFKIYTAIGRICVDVDIQHPNGGEVVATYASKSLIDYID